MKALLRILLACSLLTQGLFAADPILDALQKGLLEEEANQNFEAAIQAYQTVIRQSEDQRKIAATAVFRLGECYRKLGKTNEAVAQYQQVLRDYSDQAVLVNISRQNLTALGMASAAPVSGTNQTASVVVTSEEEQEIKRIQAMIRNSPDLVNARVQESGLTPLHQAAMKGQLLVAGFLLDNGADPNARSAQGGTPLHQAAYHGHKAMVELLLSKGADINAIDQEGSTPLGIAARKGYRTLAKALLEKRANVNGGDQTQGVSPLWLALYHQQPAIVELLLEAQADASFKNRKQGDESCLMVAATYSKAMVELLLAKGAVVDAVDQQENSALIKAAGAGQTEIVNLLLRHKVDPNRRNKQEQTPLVLAIQAGDDVMVKSLLTAGADANAAASYVRPRKDQPGSFTSYGMVPPLVAAVYQDHPEIVDLLLVHKADPNARDNSRQKNWPVLSLAVQNKNLKTCQLLLEHGAKPQETDVDGYTPLHYAVMSQTQEITALLLQHQADPNAVNRNGETPLDIANRIAARSLPPRAVPIRQLRLPGLPPAPGVPSALGAISIPAASPDDQTSSKEDGIMKLLRQAGANDFHQRLQAIWLSRPSLSISTPWFQKGTNTLNRFSLGEVVWKCLEYPEAKYRNFIDLSQVKVRRLETATGQEKVIPIDYDTFLIQGDCSQEFWLEWGDIVEIPETDHLVDEKWPGPKKEWIAGLDKCLQRHVQVVVRGQTNHLVLKPRLQANPASPGVWVSTPPIEIRVQSDPPPPVIPSIKEIQAFGLYEVVKAAGVLRASSDLSRIQVTRIDPATGQPREMVFDCRESSGVNDLWLRDGDVIEIPDRN